MEYIPQYYTYIILFRTDKNDDGPIIRTDNCEQIRKYNEGRMHLLDEDLIPILPAVNYCLHLPRTEMDTYDVDVEVLDNAYDVPQNIIPVPDIVFLRKDFSINPTCIFFAEDIRNEAKEKAYNYESLLGAVSISDLSNNLLSIHWKKLYQFRRDPSREELNENGNQIILEGDKRWILPALFMARQHDRAQDAYEKIRKSSNYFRSSAELLLNQRIVHDAIMHCSGYEGGEKEVFIARYEEGLKRAKVESKINVVICMPGIANSQKKKYGFSNILPDYERTALKLIGLHRAIARQAILMELPLVNEKIYEKYDELESNCKRGTNNKYVQKILREIGELVLKQFNEDQLMILTKARHITVFSDFPIGLSIFPNTDTAFHGYKELSYRPLSPLTRCFQVEMGKHKQVYIGKRCKIAYAECILNDEENKHIRMWSSALIQSLNELSKTSKGIEFCYAETSSIDKLKKFISENSDADILHISAHGYYEKQSNMAGLLVGKEFWMADDLKCMVPPVVILSACHVCPRGGGAVCVADMFMRLGAQAVLGTFVPVFADRNTVLINRLYTYIAEAQKGSSQYKTLSELWAGLVCTNAIFEMANSSPGFGNWIFGNNASGMSRIEDFTMKRSIGRLHGPTIYSDTKKIIEEMLLEEGMTGKFENILDQDDYFQESFFYQWIGYPENIFLYNEILSRADELLK